MVAVVKVTSKQLVNETMSVTSKTGLLPSVKKSVKSEFQGNTMMLQVPNIVVPAPFTLRPFAGVYNPFPYGCSILCNHPADFEAKSIVKKAKDAWITEGKSLIDLEEISALKRQEKNQKHDQSNERKDNSVPEELFRKYTDTDSRPITPAPTLESLATKGSQNLRTRRCMTPDPTSFIPTKEKTLLVLDLRRSHSQDTVCWQGGQGVESNYGDVVLPETSTSRATSPSVQSTSQTKKKKLQKKKQSTASGSTSNLKSDNSKDSDSKAQHSSADQSPSKGSLIQEEVSHDHPEISPDSSSDDKEVIKRRGKKRKGRKTGMKEGDKEFKGIPDPGETQVSAMETDSKEGSSKASLVGDENVAGTRLEEIQSGNLEGKANVEGIFHSFLETKIIKQLQRQLDQEVVDSEFNSKRKIALEEALRCKVTTKHSQHGEEMKSLKNEFQLAIKNSEKWLSIPRVFTRQSARFELPMDSRLLNDMTPLEYVQKYVFVSPERLVLYNHVFNLYKEEPEDDEETERILLGKNVIPALGKIMGRSMMSSEASELQNLLDWKNQANLDFRTFAGIAATCERFMAPRFCSKMPSQEEDPRHRVERADFETLDGKLLRLNPDRRLATILKSIKDL